jgi:hypothetical protein
LGLDPETPKLKSIKNKETAMTSGMAGEIRGEKEHSGSQDTSIFKE